PPTQPTKGTAAMTTYYAPAERNLTHSKIRLDCDPALIRAIWKADSLDALVEVYPAADGDIIPRHGRLPSLREAKRAAIDDAAGSHGVTHLGWRRRKPGHSYHLSAGGPDVPTLSFCGDRMAIGWWGDLVARGCIES